MFLTFVKKEFIHVLRDRRTLLILFGLPVVQIIIFGFALTNEVKNAKLLIIDHAKDPASQQIINRTAASRYFDIAQISLSYSDIETAFRQSDATMALIFPQGFMHDLLHTKEAHLQIITDASDPNTANTLTHYLSAIIEDYQQSINGHRQAPFRITTETLMLYNPQLEGAPNFVPGVMALVLMLVCVMMTAVSIVREKETGTMEVLLVSPFKPVLVIISKAFPYLLLSLINVFSILVLSIFVLDLPVEGSILLLTMESIIFIITCLSLGILISVKAQSQQTAMLISLMGMLLPTILFSGFMFPIENMPWALQVISNAVPAKWYYIIVKSIMVKGLGFAAIWKETLVLMGIALFFLFVSLKTFKTRLA